MIQEFALFDSFLQHLDPRVKVIVTFLFSFLIAVSDRISVLMASLILSVLLVLMAKIPIKECIRRLMPVNLLIVFLWFFLPFTVVGEPLSVLGTRVITYEGVLLATRISIKANAMMLMLIALIASTSVFSLFHALHELKISRKMVFLGFFTYRYIHVIYREYLRLQNTMKIRCFCPATSLHTYRTFAYLVAILMVRSYDRAQRVQNAMLCRGFSGKLYSLSEFSIKRLDIIFLFLMTSAMLMLGILEWMT